VFLPVQSDHKFRWLEIDAVDIEVVCVLDLGPMKFASADKEVNESVEMLPHGVEQLVRAPHENSVAEQNGSPRHR
jgi:hypothetical protein